MDFPVSLVDRLPIFPDEPSSVAALMELIRGAARGKMSPPMDLAGRSSPGQCAAMCYEEASGPAGGAAMSCFSESEGHNADAIEQGVTS